MKILKIIILPILISSLSVNANEKTISVMTYNVQNLFDTTHDIGKSDYDFIPLSEKQTKLKHVIDRICSKKKKKSWKDTCFNANWTNAGLMKKISNISKVIKTSIDNKGPDILVLTEVENINVLKTLVNSSLGELKYIYAILIEGPDERGIDVGILSRYPIINPPTLHTTDKFITRGILEATFDINGQLITIFGVHFSSQNSPDKHREILANLLKNAVLKNRKKYKEGLVIAIGDFNTLPTDKPNAIKILYDNNFENAQDKYVAMGGSWKGTFYFKKSNIFHELDRIMILKNSYSKKCNPKSICIKPLFKTFNVYTPSFITKTSLNIPYKFNFKTYQGFSDHFPVSMKFKLYNPNKIKKNKRIKIINTKDVVRFGILPPPIILPSKEK